MKYTEGWGEISISKSQNENKKIKSPKKWAALEMARKWKNTEPYLTIYQFGWSIMYVENVRI